MNFILMLTVVLITLIVMVARDSHNETKVTCLLIVVIAWLFTVYGYVDGLDMEAGVYLSTVGLARYSKRELKRFCAQQCMGATMTHAVVQAGSPDLATDLFNEVPYTDDGAYMTSSMTPGDAMYPFDVEEDVDPRNSYLVEAAAATTLEDKLPKRARTRSVKLGLILVLMMVSTGCGSLQQVSTNYCPTNKAEVITMASNMQPRALQARMVECGF
jgi:hypothetical protein